MRPIVFAIIALSAVILMGGIVKVENAELSAPPDVATSNWIPLGDSFGFVVVKGVRTVKQRQPVHLALSGYYMVRLEDVWFRLIEDRSTKVVPLAKK